LLYGTLLPAPDIAGNAPDTMRSVRDAGFEVGIHTWKHVLWQDKVAAADRRDAAPDGTRLRPLWEIFGEPARVHGARAGNEPLPPIASPSAWASTTVPIPGGADLLSDLSGRNHRLPATAYHPPTRTR